MWPGIGLCEKIHGMSRRAPIIFALLAVILTVSLACDRKGDSGRHDASTESTTVLRRGNGGDLQTLDPARAEDVHSFKVLTDLYEGLVAADGRGNIIPGVAERWDISSDGLSYTFYLREAARWSNGQPVSAEHFVAGFERALSPTTASAYGFLLYPVRNAEEVALGQQPVSALGISAPDTGTLTIELQAPAPHLLSVLAMPIAFPHWPGQTKNVGQLQRPQKFVGNGPYVLEDWKPGSHIRLRKNEYFHDVSSVRIDVVEYYPIQDLLTELNMYRSGELDITASVPGANVKSLRKTHESELRIAPSLAVYYLAFDLSEPPLDNKALRQALTMAIDRHALVEIIGRGEQPAFGLVPDGVSNYTPARFEWKKLTNAQRESEARRLFESSGYSASKPLQIKLLFDVGDIHERVALAVSAMWRDVLGVTVDLDKREWKYFLDTRHRRGEWQTMRFAWSGDYDHPSTFTGTLHSASPQNLPGYKNPRFDEIIEEAAAARDSSVQARLIASAETLMLHDYPIAPLYFYVSKHLVKPSVQGFHDNVLDQHPTRFMHKTAHIPGN